MLRFERHQRFREGTVGRESGSNVVDADVCKAGGSEVLKNKDGRERLGPSQRWLDRRVA